MPPTDSDPGDDLLLRPAVSGDLAGVHEVFVEASAGPGLPTEVRSADDVRSWATGLLDASGELWVATSGDAVVGFVRVDADWLHLMFVRPGHTGRGVGSALMDLVKGLRPRGFGLRVHQANRRARRFYLRHGLIELERTDGSGYRDGAPDVQMAWPGQDPLAYLRGRIDEVDAEVAVLLARRVALTAAVQERKQVGGLAGRDLRREQEIVERMARLVPGLGADRIARVMHTVIEESLAAWEAGSE